MAQRDERRSLLGGHDAGQPSRLQRVALPDSAATNLPPGVCRHADRAARDRFARGDGLVADVDHAHTSGGIDMTQRVGPTGPTRPSFLHFPPAPGRTTDSRVKLSDPPPSASLLREPATYLVKNSGRP